MRNLDFRVEILRENIPVGSLPFVSAPSISCDLNASIHMTLRGQFLNTDSDLINNELRPVLILDGAEHHLGVYRVGTLTAETNENGAVYDSIEAYDRAVLLTWAKLESREFYAAGTAYTYLIENLLMRAGITAAAVTPSDAVLQSDREDWDIGTSFLEIINTLLSEINYAPLWFDVEGFAHAGPERDMTAENIDHVYGSYNADLMQTEYSSELDLFAAPNVFIGIVENPEYPEPMVATAVNDSPDSRLSTIRRGIRIPQVYKLDNIASQEELQKYVDRLSNESMQQSEFISITTPLMPDHNVGDVVALNRTDLNGIFRETAWSMSLQAGTKMTHRLQRKVVAL